MQPLRWWIEPKFSCTFCMVILMAKLGSLNAKSLNSDVKRHLLLTDLKSLKADIVFLQETHFNWDGNFEFATNLYPMTYLALKEQKKAGVVILISRSCPIQVSECAVDPNGHYIILLTVYQGTPLVLCNIYVTNVSQIVFLNNLLLKLSKLPSSAPIVGGDFNVAFSDTTDKLLLPCKQISPSQKKILAKAYHQTICVYVGLFDLWRIAHPTERIQYIFFW